MIKLYTSRYQNGTGVKKSGAGPVGITLGAPRFRLAYDLIGIASELKPSRDAMGLPLHQFTQAYRTKLDLIGVDAILSRFDRLKTKAPASDGLVLLCYEDLRDPDYWCHRRMFADWWFDQTGQAVEEIPDLSTPKGGRRVPAGQDSLFELPVKPASAFVQTKARQLVGLGKVRRLNDTQYQVTGSSGLHVVTLVDDLPTLCSCRSGVDNPSVICSHRLATYMTIEATK